MASLAWVDLLAEPNTNAIVGGAGLSSPPVNGLIVESKPDPFQPISFPIYLLSKEIESLDPIVWGGPTVLAETLIYGIEAAGNFAGAFVDPAFYFNKPDTSINSGSFDETYMFEESPLLVSGNTYEIMTASCWYPLEGSTGMSFTLTKFKVYIEVAGFFWANRNLTREIPL